MPQYLAGAHATEGHLLFEGSKYVKLSPLNALRNSYEFNGNSKAKLLRIMKFF